MGLRFAIPKATKTLDEELSDRYFSPLTNKVQRLFGVEQVVDREKESNDNPNKTDFFTQRLKQQQQTAGEIQIV